MARKTIPIPYIATFKPPRRRVPCSKVMRGEVTVDIEELDGSSAPVVHVVANSTEHGRSSLLHTRNSMAVRLHDGKFFIELCKDDDDAGAKLHNVMGQNAEIYFEHGQELRFITAKPDYSSKEEIMKPYGKIRDYKDNYDAYAQAIRHRANDFKIIDGVIYRRINEPILVVRHLIGRDMQILIDESSRFFDGYAVGMPQDGILLGIDQMDKAVSIAERMARERNMRVVNHAVIESISPWAVRFRGEADVLIAAASKVAAWGWQRLYKLPTSAACAVFDLVSALSDCHRVTPRLVAALRYIDAMRSQIEDARSSDTVTIFSSSPTEELSMALELWDSRDNAGFDWVDRALDATGTVENGLLATEVSSLAHADQVASQMGLGIDAIDGLAKEASAGRGHLIAVRNNDGYVCAALVARHDGEPRIMETVSRDGRGPGELVRSLILRHVRSAVASDELDLALDGLAI